MEGISRLIITPDKKSSLFSDEELRTRGRSFVKKDESLGFRLIANHKDKRYSINSEGFRGEEFPADFNSRFKILALGESTTFGWDVKDDESYPYYLMQELQNLLESEASAPNKARLKPSVPSFTKTLQKNQDIYVINGGVPSYTSAQTLLYMREILKKDKIQPDIILINILWNDIWYSSIANWHPNILIHQTTPKWLSFLTQHSRLFYALTIGADSKKAKKDIFNQKAYSYYIDNLKEMITLAKKHNIKIAFVEPPFDADHMSENLDEFQVTYSKRFLIETAKRYRKSMHQLAKEESIPILNHSLSLDHLHQNKLFLDALHPTPKGNKIMAKDISIGIL